MDSELMDRSLENKNKYKLAAYCAFTSSILSLPYLIIAIIGDLKVGPTVILLPLSISLTFIVHFCSLYAFYRFKCFLNDYYEFHDIDIYVILLIILSIMGATAFAIYSRTGPNLKIPSFIAIVAISIVAGILGIVFSVKLLGLPVSLHGMLKPYVCITIVASICFMVIFLGPIAIVLGAVTDFMLGIILLKPKEEIEVEFV